MNSYPINGDPVREAVLATIQIISAWTREKFGEDIPKEIINSLLEKPESSKCDESSNHEPELPIHAIRLDHHIPSNNLCDEDTRKKFTLVQDCLRNRLVISLKRISPPIDVGISNSKSFQNPENVPEVKSELEIVNIRSHSPIHFVEEPEPQSSNFEVLNSDDSGHSSEAQSKSQQNDEEFPDISLPPPYKGVGNYKCTQCRIAFKSQSQLNSHRISNHSMKPIECSICSRTFSTNNSLKHHMPTHNTNRAKPFICDQCPLMFNVPKQLTRHIKVAHTLKGKLPKLTTKNEELMCEVCSKILKNKISLRTHKLRCSGLRNYLCTQCGGSFYTSSCLNEHRKRKHPTAPKLKCDECSMEFTMLKYLKTHKQNMHKEKTIRCTKCDYRCALKCQLNAHMKNTHRIGDRIPRKKVFCTKCDKSFVGSRWIKRHMETVHEGIKAPEFKCTVTGCGSSFPYSASLERHVKLIHEKVLRFKCNWEGCEKGFGAKQALQRHVAAIHEKNRHAKCQVKGCSMAFVDNYALKKHVEKQHGNKDESEVESDISE